MTQGLNDDYLPVWLRSAGINTYYVGKFLNAFSAWNMARPEPPKGWTDSTFLVDPGTYNYYNSSWTNQVDATDEHEHVRYFENQHTTDVTEQKAVAMLDEAVGSGEQFFMMVAGGRFTQGNDCALPIS